jgi:hypothetical protein
MYADYVPAATYAYLFLFWLINLPGISYEGENFVLDGQVLRAALKAFRGIFTSTPPATVSSLSPTSHYLRLLLDKNLVPPELSSESWTQPEIAILLLEWRAALLVHESARTLSEPDATVTQRVSRAVTEAFVAARVGEMMDALGPALKQREAEVVRKLYILVRFPLTGIGIIIVASCAGSIFLPQSNLPLLIYFRLVYSERRRRVTLHARETPPALSDLQSLIFAASCSPR